MANKHRKITDAAVDQLKAKLGEKRPVTDPFNETAGKDAIRHFVHGIGDSNPLFTDEDYARSTGYGGLIAPPCFLFSMIGWNYPRGLPGVHGMWAGAEFDCALPIRVDDRITAVVYLSKVEELSVKPGEPIVTTTSGSSRLREDKVDSSLAVEQVRRSVPRLRDGFVVVPRILEV